MQHPDRTVSVTSILLLKSLRKMKMVTYLRDIHSTVDKPDSKSQRRKV